VGASATFGVNGTGRFVRHRLSLDVVSAAEPYFNPVT